MKQAKQRADVKADSVQMVRQVLQLLYRKFSVSMEIVLMEMMIQATSKNICATIIKIFSPSKASTYLPQALYHVLLFDI